MSDINNFTKDVLLDLFECQTRLIEAEFDINDERQPNRIRQLNKHINDCKATLRVIMRMTGTDIVDIMRCLRRD